MKYLLAITFASLLTASCGKTIDCINFDNVDPNMVCPLALAPVCGCDNMSYTNACFAQRSGVVSWIDGPCP